MANPSLASHIGIVPTQGSIQSITNQIKGMQSYHNISQTLNNAQNTQKQICSKAYPGLTLSQHGGKRKRTSKRKHTRKCKCKCRGKCKCRKTRRRRKSYKKKRK